MVDTHRVRSPEERRRLELARRRYARRYRRIEDLKRRGPQFIMVLLSLLAISLILYRLFGPELLKSDDEEIADTYAETTTQVASDVRVDPVLLQSEIEAFEQALFGNVPARSLGELGGSIAAEAGLLAEKARQLSEERPKLAGFVDQVETINAELQSPAFNLERLEELRQDWLDIRTQTLHRASWFSSPTASAVEDSSSQAAYQDAASSLLDIVESARSEAESFADRIAEGEKIDSEWREFESDFTAELREIELTIPAERPGTEASIQLLAAIQKLERAVDFTRERVAVETPSHPLNRRAYDQAVDSAQEAVDAFEAAWN